MSLFKTRDWWSTQCGPPAGTEWEALGASPPSGGVDLSYWDLHGFLLVPTAFLLTAGQPALLKEDVDPLRRRACSLSALMTSRSPSTPSP